MMREAQARGGAAGPGIQFERGTGAGGTVGGSAHAAALRQQAQLNVAFGTAAAAQAMQQKRTKWDTSGR